MTLPMWHVTLGDIRSHNPCKIGWRNVLESKLTPSDYAVPFPILDIIKSNCLDDMLWATRALDERHHKDLHLLAIWLEVEEGLGECDDLYTDSIKRYFADVMAGKEPETTPLCMVPSSILAALSVFVAFVNQDEAEVTARVEQLIADGRFIGEIPGIGVVK